MDVLGAVAGAGAKAHAALLLAALTFLAAGLWALRRRRWGLTAATLLPGAVATFLYTGGEPAEALTRLKASASLAITQAAAPFVSTAGPVAAAGSITAAGPLLTPGLALRAGPAADPAVVERPRGSIRKPGRAAPPAPDAAPDSGAPGAAPRRDRSRPSYALRWQNRPPDDFPLPPVFQFEYSTSQQTRNRTIRYRFRGEPADAVRDLHEMGKAKGWQVEVKAPHRLVFRKGGRMVEAWFSYAARSVVLDVSDARG